MNEETQAQIRASGMVQAVIASGMPPEKWSRATAYGLNVASYFTAKILKAPAKLGEIPEQIKTVLEEEKL